MPWLSRLFPKREYVYPLKSRSQEAETERESDCEHDLVVAGNKITCRRCPAEWRRTLAHG